MTEHAPPLPTDDVTDQEVDTAGTEADDQQARSPIAPGTMHRAEDDAAARAGSRDFSEQPDRATSQPPSRTTGD